MDMKHHAALVLIAAALLCLPPFLLFRLCARYYKRARRHGLARNRYVVAFGIALAGFLYNLGALVSISYLLATGGDFGPFHAVAVAIAWVTFWAWLFLAFALGRDIGRRPKSGQDPAP